MALARQRRGRGRRKRIQGSGRWPVALELRPQDLHTRGCLHPQGHLVPADTDDLEPYLRLLTSEDDRLARLTR
jgi:hypothetical protein